MDEVKGFLGAPPAICGVLAACDLLAHCTAPASVELGDRGPSAAVVQYDLRTGRYTTPDGHTFRQTDLVASATPKSWKDILPA